MVEREFVNEYIFRTKCFIRGIDSLKRELIKESKKPISQFRKLLVMDTISSLKNVKKNNDFKYIDAFLFQLCFSGSFEEIKKTIIEGKHDLKENFFREDYWVEEEIQYIDALYFSYPYLLDSYKTEINIDMKKLEELINKSMKKENKELVAKNYVNFIKKVNKKS